MRSAYRGLDPAERITMSAEPDADTTDAPTPNLESFADAATDAAVCGALGCRETDDLRPAQHPERGERILCSRHRREYLGVRR